MSSACLIKAVECRNKIKKNFFDLKTISPDNDSLNNSQIGNPASIFCSRGGGLSVILEDKNHNEYDFCKISEKYFVDSWDLYKWYKK